MVDHSQMALTVARLLMKSEKGTYKRLRHRGRAFPNGTNRSKALDQKMKKAPTSGWGTVVDYSQMALTIARLLIEI